MGKRGAAPSPQKQQQKKAAKNEEASDATGSSLPSLPAGLWGPVQASLTREGELAKACRSMLLTGLPFALCTPSEERHGYQNSMVSMADVIISDGEAQRGSAVTQAEGEIAQNEAAKAASGDEIAKAAEAAAASAATKDAAAVVETEAAQALAAAQSQLKEAQASVSSMAEEKSAVVADKEQYTTAMAESWAPLKASELDGRLHTMRKKKTDIIVKLLKGCDVPVSMLEALQAAFKTKAAERGTFAVKTLDAGEAAMTEHIAQLEAKIQGFSGEASSRDTAVEQAQAALESAQGTLEKAQDASCASQNTWVDLESTVVGLRRTASKLENETKSLAKKLHAAQAAVETFGGIVSKFAQLRDGVADEPEAEAPAEAEMETEAAEGPPVEAAPTEEVAAAAE